MNKIKHIVLCVTLALVVCACTVFDNIKPQSNTLSLEGSWVVKLDPDRKGNSEGWSGMRLSGETISLPGTLDDAKLGAKSSLKPVINNDVLSHLTRAHEFIGVAWYQKEIVIPDNWDRVKIMLTLERVIWESSIFVDGEFAGKKDSLIASHDYDLTQWLTPGKHLITIRIDNSDQHPTINYKSENYPLEPSKQLSHAYTNHTQIKWNGVVGALKLTATPYNQPSNLQVYSDIKNNTLAVRYTQQAPMIDGLSYKISDLENRVVANGSVDNAKVNNSEISFSLSKPEAVALWDEFSPNLYKLEIKSGNEQGKSTISTKFGFREIHSRDGQLMLNNHRIFLRGNLDTATFPLTGYPPTTKEEWTKIIELAKTYGLNHFRFHSWTPPKGAFEAADEIGFYFQVELPHWSHTVGADKAAADFLKQESVRIINTYGNHPSFILMSMGNELQGDVDTIRSLVSNLKKLDNRRLFTSTSYTLHKPRSLWPLDVDQFYVASRTEKGWIRGQGFFNDNAPSFDMDHSQNSDYIDVPIIAHEIGQYAVFPDMSEIPKYTGVLKPVNFIAVKQELEKKNLLQLADSFTSASGELAALLYKEEIERALKTPGFDGFHLLQLQDFPGQGTALVGLLNVFWESKGAISAEEFRTFNSEVVPLIRFEKAVYENGETFVASVEVANFFRELKEQNIRWSISNSAGNVIKQGELTKLNLAIGNNLALGNISLDLNVNKADKLTVELTLPGTDYKNAWSFWVYPKNVELESDKVLITTSFDEAEVALKQGKKVLLNPDFKKLKGVEGRFVPVFWSPVQFPDQAGTMGMLVDPAHQAFAHFPTESHTNWQWWDLAIQSKSIEVDESQVTSIVRVIDNFVSNRHLANVVEAKVGPGKLIFSSIDLTSNLKERPAARQLRSSLLNYMENDAFNPSTAASLESLKALLSN